MSVVDGIVSGLDTTAIIKQLMAVERAPITRFQAKEAELDKKLQAWTDIQTAIGALRSSTTLLARSSTFTQSAATSSNTALATAVARDGANPGRVTFKVRQLATAATVMTSTSVGSSAQLVGAGKVGIAVGLQSLGVTAMSLGAGAAGSTLDVTVAPSSATQVEVTVGTAKVTVDRTATSVNVGGLQLSIGSGGLVNGSGKVQIVETTSGSTVGSLASSLTVARAQVLGVGTTQQPDSRLVLTSIGTGATNQLLVAQDGLTAPMAAALGAMNVVSAAKDAQVEIGTGLVVSRSTNVLTDLLDGVTIQLVKADPAADVTIDASIDEAGLATKVKTWVNSMNNVLALIDTKSAYDPAGKSNGVLLGDSNAQRVRQSLTASLTAAASDGTFKNLPQIGVSVDRKGRYAIDDAVLGKAIATDAGAVGKLFARSATASNAAVSFVSAADTTIEGSYAVAITRAATQASVTGSVFATLGAAERLDFTLGTASATVALAAGQTPSDVVSAINAAFAAKGFGATADLDGGAVRVRSTGYGSAVALGVTSAIVGAGSTGLGGATAGTATILHGVDVEGMIDGVAALGVGQGLTASTGRASGLRLRIDATTTGSLGTIAYAGGTGGTLMRSLASAGSVDTGISSSTTGITALRRSYDDRIADLERRAAITEARLRRQFTNLETTLGQLRAQGSRLSATLASGNSTNGN